jgi:hypothetical protein
MDENLDDVEIIEEDVQDCEEYSNFAFMTVNDIAAMKVSVYERIDAYIEYVKKNKPNMHQKAKDLVTLHQRHLASIQNQLYAFDMVGDGWYNCTTEFRRYCNMLSPGQHGTTIFNIVLTNFRIDFDQFNTENHSCYFRWKYHYDIDGTVDYFQGRWIIYNVPQDHALFPNGLLNLKTLELTETEGIIFGPTIGSPFTPELRERIENIRENGLDAFQKDFKSVLDIIYPDNPARIWHMLDYVSIILQPHFNFKGEFYFTGPSNTLKSTFTKAIAYSVGKKAVSEITQANLCNDRWSTVDLVNKFINISDDTDTQNTKKYYSWMKNYTGTGNFRVEEKHCKPVSVPATAKLFNCQNYLPHYEGEGYKVRIVPFQFRNQIHMSNSRSLNQDIWLDPNFWLDRDRQEGVLAILIYCLSELHKRGEFLNNENFNYEKKEQIEAIDPESQHLQDAVYYDKDSFTPTKVLASLFTSNPSSCDYRKVCDYVRQYFPKAKKKKKGSINGYIGIRIDRDEGENNDDK